VRFLIISNELPNLTDASGVIASRCMLIRLRQSFLGREDTCLTEKLMGELPGILNWAIEGLRRLRERGHFVQPASSAEMIELLEDVASPIRRFIKECCEVGPGSRPHPLHILTNIFHASQKKGAIANKTQSALVTSAGVISGRLMEARPTWRILKSRGNVDIAEVGDRIVLLTCVGHDPTTPHQGNDAVFEPVPCGW
jgi:hypothetical protein